MCEVNFWTVSAVEESFDPSLAIYVLFSDAGGIFYRSDIHVEWPNVSSRLGLDYLFLRHIANGDVHNETSPFEI